MPGPRNGGWGYAADAPLGLHLLGARYYDAAAGRFLNPDPIGFAGGLNLYGYTGNDPVNQVDPSGLSPWEDIAGAAAGLLQLPGTAGKWL